MYKKIYISLFICTNITCIIYEHHELALYIVAIYFECILIVIKNIKTKWIHEF
jgi:hypothetical protein